MAFTTSSTSTASHLSPQPAQPPQAQQEVLPAYASEHPYFTLLYHPLRWGWLSGRWLPILRKLSLTPGSQNVDKQGDPSMAIAVESQQGWIAVPHTVLPGEDYVVAYAARGGLAHFSRWEKLKLLGGRLTTSSDEHGYADYLERVCARLGWTPDPDVVEGRITALEAECVQDEAAAPTDLKAAHRAKEARKVIDAMRASLQPVVEPVVEATPSPRRKS
ncbi:MAG: hypothetical protein E6Q97_19350 [Desulfurellales bacterium]|nr:MAG: hypothetical protein E6Q97_19350 [Desulfurellales bacterium]